MALSLDENAKRLIKESATIIQKEKIDIQKMLQ